jgi:hypothetical protein
LSATSREREERVRKIRESQDDERRRKLEELKEHVRFEFPAKNSIFEFREIGKPKNF